MGVLNSDAIPAPLANLGLFLLRNYVKREGGRGGGGGGRKKGRSLPCLPRPQPAWLKLGAPICSINNNHSEEESEEEGGDSPI